MVFRLLAHGFSTYAMYAHLTSTVYTHTHPLDSKYNNHTTAIKNPSNPSILPIHRLRIDNCQKEKQVSKSIAWCMNVKLMMYDIFWSSSPHTVAHCNPRTYRVFFAFFYLPEDRQRSFENFFCFLHGLFLFGEGRRANVCGGLYGENAQFCYEMLRLYGPLEWVNDDEKEWHAQVPDGI